MQGSGWNYAAVGRIEAPAAVEAAVDFLRVAGEVAKGYPEIQFEDRIVDNMCMQLMQKPDEYDVLVMGELNVDLILNQLHS